MIEQINGPGLTGITGKTGKQGKNSLFAKLFAMLDKHAEASGKGKGLQFNATGLAKGKTMIAATGKGDSLIAKKVDPLAAAKGKQLVALAVKGKLGSDTVAEETATPLVTANVIIDQSTQNKKSELTGKANILIAEHKADVKGEQTKGESTKDAFAKGEFTIGESTKDAFAKGEFTIGESTKGAFAKGEITAPVLKQAQQTQLASTGKGEAVDAEQVIQSANKSLTAASEAKALASAKEAFDSDQLLKTADKSQTSTLGTKTAEPGTHVQKPVINGQTSVNTQGTIHTAEQIVESPQKVTLTADASKSLGEKVDVQQPKAETINVAAGAQLQQGKQAQSTLAQNSAATVAASTTVQAGTSDASLADSGSGSSDKGSQEGRLTSALSGDTKSTNTSSTNNANFQSYLTGKTAPTMSVFDSMKHIAQSAANGQSKLEIQLDPANLGKIQITLQTDAAKNLQVHMVVDQGTTRAALEQQLPALRAALSQQGFDLSGFSMGSNGQQETFADGGRNGSKNLADQGDNLIAGNSNNSVQQQSTRRADGSLSIRI